MVYISCVVDVPSVNPLASRFHSNNRMVEDRCMPEPFLLSFVQTMARANADLPVQSAHPLPSTPPALEPQKH